MAAAVEMPQLATDIREPTPMPMPQTLSRPSSPPQDQLPTQAEIDQCAKLPVFDVDGQSHEFQQVYSGTERTMVIFVRHFFCGMCQEYLRALSQEITLNDLSSATTPTKIVVIGCGSHSLIREYTSNTTCPYETFADPSQKLYDILKMTSSLSLGPSRPEYQKSSVPGIVVRSILSGLRSGSKMHKAGPLSQLGGEIMFEDGKAVWCHRMTNTRNHTEASQLRKVMGL